MEAVPLEVPLNLSLKTEKCNGEVSWDVSESPVPNPMVFLFGIQSDFYWRLKLVKIKIANFNFNLSCL